MYKVEFNTIYYIIHILNKMVFQQLEIILGVIINTDDLKLLSKEFDEDDYGSYVRSFSGNIPQLPKKSQLYDFPCCSNLSQEIYILGYSMHTYDRKFTKCDYCPKKYFVCDICIGETTNGYYDVETILNMPTEVNPENLCLYCFFDNKQKINTACHNCNKLPFNDISPLNYLKLYIKQYTQLNRFLKKYKLERHIKFYYMLDDCLSCT